jgi:predicted O-methyltransferase YrrM
MTLERLAELAMLPPVEDPRTFGRDESNPYYDFLAHLVRDLPAHRVLELGTCMGGSASYFAAGSPDCQIITIDLAPKPQARVNLSRLPNVDMWTTDSRSEDFVERVRRVGPFDIIFFDTVHDYVQILTEWRLHHLALRAGGVALFDDIRINEGMARFWDELDVPKVELNQLHETGFGAALHPLDYGALNGSGRFCEVRLSIPGI